MVTKHDNVAIIRSNSIESVKWIESSSMATQDQPFDEKPKIDVSDGVVTIIFSSGRKKSKPVAEKFISLSGEGNMYAPQGGSAGKPKELNFMFGLLIKFKDGSEHEVFLAQGSNGPRNNWWIGSHSLSSFKVSGGSMKTEIGKAYDKLGGVLSEPFNHVHSFLGKLFSKDLFNAVNIFILEK